MCEVLLPERREEVLIAARHVIGPGETLDQSFDLLCLQARVKRHCSHPVAKHDEGEVVAGLGVRVNGLFPKYQAVLLHLHREPALLGHESSERSHELAHGLAWHRVFWRIEAQITVGPVQVGAYRAHSLDFRSGFGLLHVAVIDYPGAALEFEGADRTMV